MPLPNEPKTISEAPTIRGLNAQATETMMSLIFYHRDGSQMALLFDGSIIVVGRSQPADVVIRDLSLSRQHARFLRQGDRVFVEDLQSTNGTLVNGSPITNTKIKVGDEIKIGAVTAALQIIKPQDENLPSLESYDEFLVRLDEELTRSQTFGRPLSLLMVRAPRGEKGHLHRWAGRLHAMLRSVDRLALYSANEALILLPETNATQAYALATRIIEEREKGEPALLCGLAMFPDDAVTVEELQEVARRASLLATVSAPLQPRAGERQKAPSAAPVIVSASMQQVMRIAEQVADSPFPVLIIGETGTGKEIVARTIHESSKRRKKPLRTLNCAAIPAQLIESVLFGHEKGAFTGAVSQQRGLFEETNGGTLLLDEIGELSLAAQAALLRVLETKRIVRIGSVQEHEVDVRIIAATHRQLEEMCEAETFRWDLYYRLNAMIVAVPPLRERPEDILPMAERFIEEANRHSGRRIKGLDALAEELLLRYVWPGNVRELRNVMERAVAIAQNDKVTAEDLSEKIRRSRGPVPDESGGPAENIKDRLLRYEAQLLIEALEHHGWNQTDTARALKMPLRTLVHKIKQHGIRKQFVKDK